MALSDIRQLAMDWADEQSNPSTGKLSVAWWNRQINYAKDVLAQETGYYLLYHPVSVTANVRSIALPGALCWGVLSALYLNEQLDASSLFDLQERYSDWRDTEPGTPDRYAILGGNIEIYPAPTRTVIAGGTLLAATAGGNFGNQPANDGVEVLSSSAADTTQTVTIYGTTFLTGTVVSEIVTLIGTTAVSTSKTDWGDILGIELSAACAGNVTIREASGNQTITTITAGATAAGVATPSSTDGGKAQPLVKASGASTAVVGLVGTDEDAATLTDNAVALCGTADTTQFLPKRMDTVTKVLLGAVASAQNVTVTRGAALQILAGSLPTDMSQETDTPTGLPAQFINILAHGAAAMATLSDLYDESKAAKANSNGQAFWRGIDRLTIYLSNMQRERQEAFRVDASLGWEHYNRR